jgi:hypothetical protein
MHRRIHNFKTYLIRKVKTVTLAEDNTRYFIINIKILKMFY